MTKCAVFRYFDEGATDRPTDPLIEMQITMCVMRHAINRHAVNLIRRFRRRITGRADGYAGDNFR